MKKSILLLLVLSACCGSAAVLAQTTADSCGALLKRLEALGKKLSIAEMLPLMPKAEAACAAEFTKVSRQYAEAISTRGFIYQAAGKHKEALQVYLEERNILQQVKMPVENEEYGNLQSNIGQLYGQLGQYDQAEAHNDSALWIARIVSGVEHVSYGNRLLNKGTIFYKRPNRNLDSAEFYLRKGIAVLRIGNSPYQLSSGLNSLGMVVKEKGRFDEAIACFHEAYEVGIQAFGEKHYAPTVFFSNEAATIFEKGHYQESEKMLERAVKMYEALNYTGNTFYTKCLVNLAVAKTFLGKYDEAAALYKKVEQYVRANLIVGSDYAELLNELSVAPLLNGEEYKAIEMLNKSVALFEQAGNTTSAHYIQALSHLGRAYDELGDQEKAVFYHDKALRIAKGNWDAPSHQFAVLVQNAAVAHSALGENSKAKSLLEEALAVVAADGPNTPVLAGIDYSYGWYYHKTKQYDLARHYLEESRRIMDQITRPEKVEYCQLLESLAILESETGNTKKAEKLYQRTLELLEKGGNTGTQKFLVTASRYAQFQAARGKPEKALPLYRLAQSKLFERIEANFNILTENGKERFLQKNAAELDNPKNFARQNADRFPAASSLVYDNELAIKGLLLHSAHTVAASIRASGDTTLLQRFEAWKTAKQLLARQYSLPAEERLVRRAMLDSLVRATEATEIELTRQSAAFRTARLRVGWQQVRDRLRSDEAAVEFIFFRSQNAVGEPSDSVYYAALVLRPGDQAPRFVPLFEAKKLTNALRRGKMRSDEYVNDVYRGLTLYQLLWQPLESSLTGVRTVHYARAGLLHGISFAAIPIGGGQFLCDRYVLQMHGSTRDLVTTAPLRADSIHHALVCGGIRYDSLSQTETAEVGTGMEAATGKPRSARGSFLNYLPSTELERKQVVEILGQHKVTTEALSGYAASEARIRSIFVQKNAPQLLHIATHGFYDVLDTAVAKTTLLPMLASGVALAGAQAARAGLLPPPGHADGLLYAYEIADLDLTGTHLAVLSACETGLGDVRGNEGVYGLQRAFKVAGTDYVLMSLWEVDDVATADFMTTFYRYFFKGKEIREAFELTQQEMRKKYQKPYLWAAFVLI